MFLVIGGGKLLLCHLLFQLIEDDIWKFINHYNDFFISLITYSLPCAPHCASLVLPCPFSFDLLFQRGNPRQRSLEAIFINQAVLQ